MSQEKILKLLNKRDKLLSREIVKLTGLSRGTVSVNLKRLIKSQDIRFEKFKTHHGYSCFYKLK